MVGRRGYERFFSENREVFAHMDAGTCHDLAYLRRCASAGAMGCVLIPVMLALMLQSMRAGERMAGLPKKSHLSAIGFITLV